MADVPREDELKLELLRELTPADFEPADGASAKTPIIKQLRHSHHLAAKLIAEGRRGPEIMAITGYSASRISILKNDPAFRDLVAYYKSQVDAAFESVHSKLAALGASCVDELLERLEDPDKLSTKQVVEIMEATLDRSSAPKKGAAAGGPAAGGGVVINVGFVDPAPKGPTIEIKPDGSEHG